jgi:cold shock protein
MRNGNGGGRPTTQYKGTIKRLVRERGFGFLAMENGTEYFFHRSQCPEYDAMREGDHVMFTAGSGPKGPRAEDVTRL